MLCHSIHLCASAACQELPKSIEQFAQEIVIYFAHSSKRIGELKEYQIFANLKPHKLLKPSQTRWLSSQVVVNRIIESWPALQLFFTNETWEETSINPKKILDALYNVLFKLYFYFLGYVLDIINKLNLEFQSEIPKLYKLLPRASTLYRTLLRNFMKPEYISTNLDKIQFNPSNYNIDNIYCGANCQLLIETENTPKNDLNGFKVKCLAFYVELCKQISVRFSFNGPVLKHSNVLDPRVAISGFITSLAAIMKHFPTLVPDVQKVDSEWRLLQECEDMKKLKNRSAEEFWSAVKDGTDNCMFPNLSIFIKGLLALSHSSATCERVFSQLCLIKSKSRNRLLIDTCNALLHTKELLDKRCCYEYTPSVSLLSQNVSNTQETTELLELEMQYAGIYIYKKLFK